MADPPLLQYIPLRVVLMLCSEFPLAVRRRLLLQMLRLQRMLLLLQMRLLLRRRATEGLLKNLDQYILEHIYLSPYAQILSSSIS